jgi:hypothetical protein
VVCSDTSLKVNSLDILADYEFVSCLKDMARSVSVVLLRCLVFVWLVEGSVLRSCLLAIWNDCRVSAPGSVKLGNRPVFALGQLYLWWGRAGNPHGCCLIRSACQRCFGQRNAWERERERERARLSSAPVDLSPVSLYHCCCCSSSTPIILGKAFVRHFRLLCLCLHTARTITDILHQTIYLSLHPRSLPLSIACQLSLPT